MWTLTASTVVYAQLLGVVFGYLIGSMPSDVLLMKAGNLGIVRKTVLGNMETSEALILDVVKGAMAVLIAYWLALAFNDGDTSADIHQEFSVWFAAGIGAFLGHLLPVRRRFRGGKGFGTYLGVLIGWWWPVALAFCVTWLIVAGVSRYSSLATLLASMVAPLAFYWCSDHFALTTSMIVFEQRQQDELLTWATALMAIVIFWRYREDIKRLLSGTETKIGTRNL
jgi:acyl phosphate:glycerol-3-phosphate acyltransferase